MRQGVLWSVLGLSSLLAVGLAVGCDSDEETNTNPCPGGICGSGGDGTGGNGNGGNGTAGAGGCAEIWLCSPWDTGGNGDAATRECVETAGCGTMDNKPTTNATLPTLDEPYYRCNVEPILDKFCAQMACHGVEPDLANGDPGRALRTYHRGRLRITGEIWTEPGCLSAGTQKPSENCIGSIECYCFTLPHSDAEWQRNFDAARGFGLDSGGQTLGDMTSSELLTQPDKGGGLPHAGIKIWSSSDTDYQTILDWLNGTTKASCNTIN